MRLAPGTRFGPYEIQSMLGAGGMGEVYRARDTRLDREVAIKILPAHIAANPEMRQRFEREARAISSLHHPNICALHDVGSQDDSAYLVMEYLEGEPLDKRIARGPLPVSEALAIGTQIASALDEAHRKRMVHRDIKPGNVILTASGAKLLDFGLAKAAATGPLAESDATLTQNLTTAGAIVGTLSYMAPERLEGKEGDTRADIFALGAMLHEMLTGKKAFSGDSQASVITTIMTAEPPPVSQVQPLATPALDRAIRKCLAKSADQRWQTARDLMSELEWIAGGGAASGTALLPTAPPPARSAMLPWALTAAAIAALAGTILLRPSATTTEAVPVRFEIPIPVETLAGGLDIPSPSPDGTKVAFTARTSGRFSRIWIHDLATGASHALEGPTDAALPFWAPDSRRLGYVEGRTLKTISASGGAPGAVCELKPNFGAATWNEKDVIVFGNGGKLFQVPAQGGVPSELKFGGPEQYRYWPQFLPGGAKLLFSTLPSENGSAGVYAASLDGGTPVRLVDAPSKAVSGGPGYLLYNQDTTLVARAFDEAALTWTGEPFPLAGRIRTFSTGTAGGAYLASWNGLVTFRTGTSGDVLQMTWVNRAGLRTSTVGKTGDYSSPEISPDGKWIAVGIKDAGTGNRDLWVFDLRRGTGSRITSDPGDELNPSWSPDGKQIAFTGSKGEGQPRNLFVVDASGSQDPQPILTSQEQMNLEEWTADGRNLIYNLQYRTGDKDLFLLPLGGDRTPRPLVKSKFSEEMGRVSPDGRWLAYRSDESGRPEIYVRPFSPSGEAAGRKWRISTDGGSEPEWRADGKELFYVNGTALEAVAVRMAGSEFEAELPERIFDCVLPTMRRNRYVAAADGQSFLLLTPPQELLTESFHAILNWQRLAPSRP
ncbi:MAG: protein kinase [Bryobacteraceae bacterium]